MVRQFTAQVQPSQALHDQPGLLRIEKAAVLQNPLQVLEILLDLATRRRLVL